MAITIELVTATSANSFEAITIQSPIEYTSNAATTITFLAAENIAVDSSITSSNAALNINLYAQGNVVVADSVNITTAGGNLVVA